MRKVTLLSFAWLAAGLLALAGCKTDGEVVTPVGPEGPAGPTTPYALVVPARFPPLPPAPADNPLTVEGVALGRQLFYETALSVNSAVSCGTCHRQELAFTDGLGRARGVNGTTTLRGAMSLGNVAWEPLLTWDGAGMGLEAQARIPIENPLEMHQSLSLGVARLQGLPAYPGLFRKAFGSSTITEDRVLKALAQFERTLVSGNSRYDQYQRGNRTALSSYEQEGLLLFVTHPDGPAGIRGGNCSDCHGGPLQTDHAFRNNGLDVTFTDRGLGALTGRPTDDGKFRVPSLRNVGLTAPYMHDGRFPTLDSVLSHYNEHIVLNSPNLDPLILNGSNNPRGAGYRLGLTKDEKAKIVAFLHTLTDTTFTHDPRFAKP